MTALLVAAVAVVAWVVAGFGSFSVGSTVFVFAVGGAIVVAALAGGPVMRQRLDPVGVAIWAVPVLAFTALELVNYARGSTFAHPTVSILLDGPLEQRLVRTAAILLWLAAGWWLARR